MKFILASASPRRKELLKRMGLAFETEPACGEEEMRFAAPEEIVMDLSCQKAAEIAEKRKNAEEPELIIGADTIVVMDGKILGKPKDEEDAYRMLSGLQGRRHRVYTGVTLIYQELGARKRHSFFEETEVELHPMQEEEIRWYIGTKEPFDKAGGYAIQGRCAVFVKEIHGDYNTVVGLPAARLYQEFKKLGIAIYEAAYYTDKKR